MKHSESTGSVNPSLHGRATEGAGESLAAPQGLQAPDPWASHSRGVSGIFHTSSVVVVFENKIARREDSFTMKLRANLHLAMMGLRLERGGGVGFYVNPFCSNTILWEEKPAVPLSLA